MKSIITYSDKKFFIRFTAVQIATSSRFKTCVAGRTAYPRGRVAQQVSTAAVFKINCT